MNKKELLRIIKEAAKKGSTELDLSDKGITDLPPEIGQLTNLQTLDLDENTLTSLPPEIVQLTNLHSLDLDGNQLTSLPPEIGQLTNLHTLDLDSNKLTSLPPEIVQLTNLQTLYLAGNQLPSLPPEIVQLTNLETLQLNENQLTSLPPEIGQLTNLQKLVLGENQLTSVPPEIVQLTNLQRLDLDGNQLTSLPPGIGQLTNLQRLSLRGNQLTSLPPEIVQLTNLQTLYLGGNQLTSLPPEIGQLTNLETLSLWGNGLISLPPEIAQLTKLTELRVGGNPLVSPPPEIIEQGMEAVRRYFASLKEEGRVLNEVKVILVGDGGAGKTSVVKRLLRDEFDSDESQTHGVNMDDWLVNAAGAKICAHVWDFGGQVIMHSTHQFFLSERSLYVLVLDGRKEEDAEYWLKHIESFGGDSPILVVLNKIDENPGFDVNQRALKRKYEGIEDFFRVSCKTRKGIPALKKALTASLPKVEITSTVWPESWFRAKQRLEKMDASFISHDEYNEICRDVKVPDKSDQDTLVRFLHDLGVVVHFHDFELQHMHVLNPRWLTTAVYTIINSEALAESKGILELSSLARILPKKVDGFDYPPSVHPYVISIMEKFELCFHIDKDRILIPDLLEVQEPEIDFDHESCLRFRIDYDFLPKSIIPRFIVKKHAEIKGELRWRTGVVLKSEAFAATAIIRADEDAKRIYIDVNGSQRRDYLTVLRSVFMEINGGFQKLQYTERIPLPDDPEVAVSYKHLLRLEREGKADCYPDGAEREYKVEELLGTIYIRRELTSDDFFKILQETVKETDDKKSVLKKIENVIKVQPGTFGVSVDVNRLWKEFQEWRDRRRKRSKK